MKKIAGLILVLIFAASIYLWKLGSVPSGVYADEATVGYNALSLLFTGKDEFGEQFPVLFKFFGAYTPGMMVYLMVPFVKTLGLSAITIRIPSVLFGLFSVVVVYAFFRLWLERKNATIATGFYAILPWTVFVSRLGYEVTLGYLLYVVGMYFGWKGILNGGDLKWSALLLSISSYAAHVQRYLMPFLVIFLGVLLLKRGSKKIEGKNIVVSIVILVITQIPNIYLSVSHPGFWIKNDAISKNIGVTWENFSRQYLTYLSPKTIFDKAPDIDMQHEIPGIGVAYWWMFWPMCVGLWELIRKWRDFRSQFILGLGLICIIPASFSGVFISMQRALPLLLPLALVIGLGISRINRPKVMAILAIYSLILLWRSYFVLLPSLNAKAWNFGYREAATLIQKNPDTNFVFDNSRNPRSYMMIWFWLGARPSNVEFRPIVWQTDICRKQILIGDDLAISSNQASEHKLNKEGEIVDPLGNPVLLWYKTNPAEKCGTIVI
jgi:4-amino-4-deoxy-L-arabinose transferase-like glycosyltransferase